jgi:hypothetical protein
MWLQVNKMEEVINLEKPIARSLDDQARILGFAPLELAACALFYSVLSPVLHGIPFAPLISLASAFSMGASVLFLNRTHPPAHGILFVLKLFRPNVTAVMPFGTPAGAKQWK